jgi:radical SAM protein with 4Fe4S-binding SPASM domain
LIESKSYGLNKKESEILRKCENNEKIDENMEFLEELQKLGLGNFYNKKPYIQKLRVGSSLIGTNSGLPPKLNRVFLEINNNCNLSCDFCGINGVKRTKGCIGCNVWNEDSEPLKIDRWKKVIKELIVLRCNDVFIKGGDITLNWDETMKIVNMVSGNISNVYVIIHQKFLKENLINDLNNKAKLIVQIDNIRERIDGSISALILRDDQWIKEFNDVKDLIVDYVNVTESTFVFLPSVGRTDVSPPNLFNFLNNMTFHPCLGHSLTICFDGKVLPCPMMRNHKIGSVKEADLADIISDKMERIKKFWGLNLDKIEKCGKCEFKYICDDCRALEEYLTGKLKGKLLCHYNPS